jgi:hypothetical protein
VACQESGEVVRDFGTAADRLVEAARPTRRGTNVPKCYAELTELSSAIFVWHFPGNAKERLNNPPEDIARIRVVLTAPKGLFAGGEPRTSTLADGAAIASNPLAFIDWCET